jgi:hypothetical protein
VYIGETHERRISYRFSADFLEKSGDFFAIAPDGGVEGLPQEPLASPLVFSGPPTSLPAST